VKCGRCGDDAEFGFNKIGVRFKTCINCRKKRVDDHKRYYLDNKDKATDYNKDSRE